MSRKQFVTGVSPSTYEENTEDYDYVAHSSANCEMTGLIPSGIVNHAQRESYEDLYPYPPPIVKKENDQAK